MLCTVSVLQHQQTLLNQLREVTGTTDVLLLQQALQVNPNPPRLYFLFIFISLNQLFKLDNVPCSLESLFLMIYIVTVRRLRGFFSPLQVSNGDLAEAVAFLTEKNATVPQQDEEATYYQTAQTGNDRYISVGSQADSSTFFILITYSMYPGIKGCEFESRLCYALLGSRLRALHLHLYAPFLFLIISCEHLTARV